MKKPRLYHTRYFEGYKDGIQTFYDIFEQVISYYADDETADSETYTQAIQMLVDKHLKILERLESNLD